MSGPLLGARAAVLSVMALTTGAVAHVQAGGLLPGLPVLALLTVLGSLACAPLLRRPGSPRRLVVLLVAGQSAVHMALAVTAGHRGDPVARATSIAPAVPSGVIAERTGSYFDVAYASRVGEHGGGLSVPSAVLHAFSDVSAQPAMALAHLLAAAACGWWLAQGERALWLLLDLTSRAWSELVGPALRRWALAAHAAASAATRVQLPVLVVAVSAPSPQSQLRSRSVSRRGPPRSE